jgi:hypothetical protein
VRHSLRFGLQKPAFGIRDRFDGFDEYYLGGTRAYEELERRAGLVSSEDAGIAYRAEAKRWAADLQLMDGVGYAKTEDNGGKDVIVRLSGDPLPWLTVLASADRGVRGADTDQQFWQLAGGVEARGPHQRIVAEYLTGHSEVDGPRDFQGAQAAAAWDVPMHGDTLDHLSVVGRYYFFDPQTGNEFCPEGQACDWESYPDNWGGPAAALVAYWDTRPGITLLTALTWEMWWVENQEEPIRQSVVLQVAWKY